MKKFLLVLLLFLSLTSFAQMKVKENSFRKIDGFVMLDKSEHYDDNNLPMALIKISTENITAEERRRITFKGNLATYFDVHFETSEIYLYISAKVATFIEIHHPDYGKTEFILPFDLDDFCGYEMVLQNVDVAKQTILVVNSEPQNANVYIDGSFKGNTPCVFSDLAMGEHEIKLDKQGYEIVSEKIVVKENDKLIVNKLLQINKDVELTVYVAFDSKPSESEVFVDGNYVGKTPMVLSDLSIGVHELRLEKNGYESIVKNFSVKYGEPLVLSETLQVSKSSYLAINSNPLGADIYIDGAYKGKTPDVYSDLTFGKHEIKLEKEGFSTSLKIIEIKEGETLVLNETMQTGRKVSISTGRDGDEIYIDDIYVGTSPFIISLSLGKHIVKTKFKGKFICETIIVTEDKGSINVEMNFDKVYYVNNVSFKMLPVSAGRFEMGATTEQKEGADADEYPVKSIFVDDYYIGQTEVTQELWEAVMGNNPSNNKAPHKPVENVSWNDCQNFIRKLNKLTGDNFRLLTEVEWEYAARGGNKSQGYKYSGSNDIDNVAHYKDSSREQTNEVKTKQPNEIGVYDMSGNVWEWCSDLYDSYDKEKSGEASTDVCKRVLRGGSWRNNANGCRVSNRACNNQVYGNSDCGFRLAM